MSNSTQHPLSRAMPSRPEGPMRVPARALAWFGIGLGLAELLMPRKVAHAAGALNLPLLTRTHGLREIGTGIGILTSRDPSPWLWGRVAGDAIDIATVGTGLLTQRRPMRTMVSLAMLLGVAYIDMKVADAAPLKKKAAKKGLYGYGTRSGFPRPIDAMRGIALKPSEKMTPAASPSSGMSTPPQAGRLGPGSSVGA